MNLLYLITIVVCTIIITFIAFGVEWHIQNRHVNKEIKKLNNMRVDNLNKLITQLNYQLAYVDDEHRQELLDKIADVEKQIEDIGK